VKGPELFINDCSRPSGSGLKIETVIFDKLLYLPCACAVAEEGDRSVAVREEINLITDPHGIEVIGILTGNGSDT
jgi:hypothetical protein